MQEMIKSVVIEENVERCKLELKKLMFKIVS